MLKDRIEKKNLIINSLIDLQEDDGKGKGRYFVSRFIEPGLAHYTELGDIVITKETLDKFIQSMVGCPVIIDHKDVTDKNVDKLRVGTISRVWFNEQDGWYYCEGILTDDEAIDLVKNQGWNVSCAYSFVSDESQKTYHGKPIDMVFTDGEFLHLAIVEDPRYEGANIVVNNKDWDENKVKRNDKGQFSSFDEAKKEYVKLLQSKGFDAKEEDFELKAEEKNLITFQEDKRAKFDGGKAKIVDINDIKKAMHEWGHLYAERNPEKFKQFEEVFGDWDEYAANFNNNELLKFGPYETMISSYDELFAESFALNMLDFENEQVNILKKILKNNIENSISKENVIMQVLDELKNFILGVVNNEKEDEMAKVKNEDKRKLIDEIGGILKDKVDDEIIRTVIKKAEELSYEPSEDDKADNKCKNEEEEKEEAENKCKNEEEEEKVEDEDDKKEEDITKNEEEKEEKEVKNSMKDLVMGGNGQVEEQKLYISRKERLEEGNKY